ncbi:MAG TPA: type II secretion system F family protein [Geothermobacteraceae bacterium]|nr:type II secretion system F family protein [Geothermobacteraceae bacterium]
MNYLAVLFSVSAFLFAAALVGHLYLLWVDSRFAQRQLIRRRLLNISAGGMHGQEKLSLFKESALREVSPVARLIYQIPRISSLDRLLVRSNTSLNAGTFVLASLSLGILGSILGVQFLPQTLAGGLLGFGLSCIPYLYLKRAERRSQQNFYEQLPDALDLMARAIRTGHALTAAMEIVATEMPDPIKSEFDEAVDEVKFGLSLEDALNNMCQRMPLTDLRYFSITVIIHKETGGNIAQIFDGLAALIRERLQFKRQIWALTGEGRISAVVLLMLPVAMFCYLYFVNHAYVAILWTDPVGRLLLGGALAAQFIGYFVMKRMIDVEM